jgi:uncharacterized repeat protein (TIGR01451 family)
LFFFFPPYPRKNENRKKSSTTLPKAIDADHVSRVILTPEEGAKLRLGMTKMRRGAMMLRNRRPRSFAPVLALFAALMASAGALAQGQAPPPGLTARPAVAVASSSADGGWDSTSRVKPAGGDQLVSVIVKLADAPLASYAGGLPGLAPTSPKITGAARLNPAAPASQRYLAYLDARQRDFAARAAAAIPQARVLARYRFVIGGAAMVLPERDIPRLAALPGVVRVLPDEVRYADTDRSPEFIGADVIWRALAADPNLGDGGEGVIVGVIDTGIWPEHPSFADDGSYPAPPARWHGTCEPPHDESPPIACNHKLIGARESLATYRSIYGKQNGEFDSARDNAGHGTHTASTAAGNAGVQATIGGVPRGTISGIAPRAYVAAYKALGPSFGLLSDLVAAIDQGVADGVDVISYSIGSVAAPDPYEQADSLAFLDAYRAGVFVAVAAGNGGPGAGSIGSPANAPWVMSVAASTTDRRFVSALTLTAGADKLTVTGASIGPGVSAKPVVNAAALGDARCERALPAVVSDTIVLCERGVNARVEKSANVKAGGGAAMVLYNDDQLDVETDNHWVPSVHLAPPEGARVLAFTAAHTATAVLGTIAPAGRQLDARWGDLIADFSSRGPLVEDQLGVSKPDVAAPGVEILAGMTPAPILPEDGPRGELFQAIAGTSMASPHVAGAAALLKALHPDWSPGQIKSALMTTAKTDVRKPDGATPADPYDMGAGRIDLSRAGDPGLTFDISADQYAGARGHLEDLNYPSISMPRMPGRMSATRTVRSTLDSATTWTATAQAPGGVKIAVNPPRISVPARGYASLVVTVDAGAVPEGTYFGRVTRRSGARVLHIPVSFVRTQPDVALSKRCDPAQLQVGQRTTCTVTAANNSLVPATVSLRDSIPSAFTIRRSSVISATYDPQARVVGAVASLPAFKPATIEFSRDPGGTPFGYVPLASLGIAPIACGETCDDVAVTFVAPSFTYNGAAYDRVTMTTNGYLTAGESSGAFTYNQKFPDPIRPNNVIAPYWTDLDLAGTQPVDTGGGTWRAAYVTSSPTSPTWFVAEWTDAVRYGRKPADSHHTFQVWIEGGSGRIHFVYGPNSPIEDRVTVGAENADGTIGGNYYVVTLAGAPGQGTPPATGDELNLASLPEVRSSRSFSYQMRADRAGRYVTTAEMTANTFVGTSVVTATLRVRP